ncbi:MAG: hypothetical protein HYZ54_07860 [Ignavibacteriae bacterium]|nr:hypothetical protein [Ignavibacteriota bacterium]
MDSNQEYYKDLVQIFVDGETTEIENSVLFQSLAQNEYLQQELQSAVRFGKVMQESSKRHRVPPDLYSSVMSTVGFGTAQVVSKTGTIVTFLKSITLVSLGALATFGIMKLTQKAETSVSMISNQASQMLKHEVDSSSNSNNQQDYSHNNIELNNATQFNRVPKSNSLNISSYFNSVQNDNIHELNNKQNNSDDASRLKTRSQNKNPLKRFSERTVPIRFNSAVNTPLNNISDNLSLLKTNKLTAEESVIITKDVTENQPDVTQSNIGISNVKLLSVSSAPVAPPMSPSARTPLGVQKIDGLNSKSWFMPRFVSLRGMMGIIRTANTIDANSLTLTPDFAVGDIAADASWSISENTSLGVEIGRERLPLYTVQTTDGVTSYVLKNDIMWAALKCRLDYRPNLLEFLFPNINDLWYTSSLSVGFSDAGLLMKSQQMLTYNFYDRYHISVGPEFTFQLISNNNTYQSALRSGLGIGLGYEF